MRSTWLLLGSLLGSLAPAIAVAQPAPPPARDIRIDAHPGGPEMAKEIADAIAKLPPRSR